jgi:hypothetical protein
MTNEQIANVALKALISNGKTFIRFDYEDSVFSRSAGRTVHVQKVEHDRFTGMDVDKVATRTFLFSGVSNAVTVSKTETELSDVRVGDFMVSKGGGCVYHLIRTLDGKLDFVLNGLPNRQPPAWLGDFQVSPGDLRIPRSVTRHWSPEVYTHVPASRLAVLAR